MATSKPLGRSQQYVLRTLGERGPYLGTGWIWDTHSGTVRILESLVRRGLAKKVGEGRNVRYFSVKEG